MSIIKLPNKTRHQAGFVPLFIILAITILTLSVVTYATVKQARVSQQYQAISRPKASVLTQPAASINTYTAYAFPSPPTGLTATSSGSGFRLSWGPSASSAGIVRYQVLNNGQLMGESAVTNYQHNLPPLPPSCSKYTFVYTVRAVDKTGNISQPSSSASVTFGGCGN